MNPISPEDMQKLRAMQRNGSIQQDASPSVAAVQRPPVPGPKDVINDLQNKADITTFGVGHALDAEDRKMSLIISQTATDIIDKFGKRTSSNDIVSLFASDAIQTASGGMTKNTTDFQSYRDILEKNVDSANVMLSADTDRLINFDNYSQMAQYIPECSLALDTYVSNILSPDDYSKMLFDVKYNDTAITAGDGSASDIGDNVNHIIKTYKLAEKTDNIIRQTLTYGDFYVAVLPYGKEIGRMLTGLSSSGNGMLTESSDIKTLSDKKEYQILDETYHITESVTAIPLDEEADRDILTGEDFAVLKEFFGNIAGVSADTLTTDQVLEKYNKMINEGFVLHSPTDMILERAAADASSGAFGMMHDIGVDLDVDAANDSKNAGNMKRPSSKRRSQAEQISGSCIRILDPRKVVEISADDICYGYYYVEPGSNLDMPDSPLSTSIGKMYARTSNPFNPSLVPNSIPAASDSADAGAARNMKITDEKLHLIANIVVKGLSKKINKKFIEGNKQFKDIIFSLLRQEYLITKGVKVSFFMPDEVVHFNLDSIFKDITFSAKMYLAQMVNIILTKLGRGKDKRIVWVETGLDSNYSQSINRVIESLKTKEFMMSDINSIQSILSLNPAAFEDIFIPRVNGVAPIDFGKFDGMDLNLNNDEFLDYLKKSIVTGMGLPAAIVDEKDSLEYARQVSAQNTHFLRKILVDQRMLEEPFTKMIRLLYRNEYCVAADRDMTKSETVNVDKIDVAFPTPGTLTKSSLTSQMVVMQQFADTVAHVYFPIDTNNANTDKAATLSGMILKKELSQLDWKSYDSLRDVVEGMNKRKEVLANSNSGSGGGVVSGSPINPDGSPIDPSMLGSMGRGF